MKTPITHAAGLEIADNVLTADSFLIAPCDCGCGWTNFYLLDKDSKIVGFAQLSPADAAADAVRILEWSPN